MKRILSLLAIVSVLFLFGCGAGEVHHPIAGHTYENDHGSDQFTFETTGGVKYMYMNSEKVYEINTHFTYEIKKKLIHIYFDYSSVWKPSARGELFCSFKYDAEHDMLIDFDGNTYSRLR